MLPQSPEPLLLVILGPTGSGKSALAIALAEQFSGEIVSCDSVAVYRNFEIGTAKPSLEDRSRVPHHLIDVADPGEAFTAGEYARQARAAVREIAQRGHLPIVVGGTGLYLRALLEGSVSRAAAFRRTCASGCARAPPSVVPDICIAFCNVSIRLRPRRYIPTMRRSSCAPSKCASLRAVP